MLNGACEPGEDGPAPFERLDRNQRVAPKAVSGGRADLGAVRGRFQAYFSVRNGRRSRA